VSEYGEVRLVGLDDFAKRLRAIDVETAKILQKDFKAIANRIVGVVRGRMPSIDGDARKAITASASVSTKGAFASIMRPRGGPAERFTKYGYWPWLEFGGGALHARGVTGTPETSSSSSPFAPAVLKSFRREYRKKGRWLYPVIGEYQGVVFDSAWAALEKASKSSGFSWEDS
jgi:hypothetical protein